jgi:hypothetical protein
MSWYDPGELGKDLLNGATLGGYGALAGSDMMTGNNVPTQWADRNQFMGYINQGMGPGGIANQQAPQLQMGSDPFRAGQLQQMGQLQGIASGQQQGAGELAAQRQIQQALAAQQAQARMARGGNAALAYRNAANQSAALGSTGAGMGQTAALQDQQAAQGMLGQVGAAGRQGDYGVANANAGYQQNTNALNSQNYLGLMNQLGGMNQGQLAAEQAKAQGANAAQSNLLGGVLGAGGEIGGAALKSDINVKTNITDARRDIDEMLDSMRRQISWDYKDTKHGEGRFSGIAAQDLERSAIGKRIVRDAPDGKELDAHKTISATLAATARLNERLRKLEASAR